MPPCSRVAASRALTVVHARLLQVTQRRRLDDVAHDEALHRLVLRHEGPAGLAEHALDLQGRRRCQTGFCRHSEDGVQSRRRCVRT